MKYILSILTVLLTVSWPAGAQSRGAFARSKSAVKKSPQNEPSRIFFSARGGLTQFYGELNEQDMKGSYGIGIHARVTKGVALGLDYSAGKIGGQKASFFNSYFVSEYNAAEFTARWNITKQFSKKKDDLLDVIVYTGVGIMFFRANAYDIGTEELVRFSNSETSKRNQLFLRWGNPRGRAGIKRTQERIIPVGTMLDYNLTNRLKIGLDYRLYFVRTDKLDATSGQRLLNPEEEESYSDTPNDKFSLFAISLTHYLARRSKN
jgi:hypothetical protein